MKYDKNLGLICRFFFCIAITCISCNPKQIAQEESQTGLYYRQASIKLNQGDTSSTFGLLRKSFAEGEIQPMQLVLDSNLNILIDDPGTRPEMRDLIKEFSEHSQSHMVRAKEPGDHIKVMGQILDEDNRQPMSNVSVELVQADNFGLYFDEKSLWNPRLFAYLKTDSLGKFSIHTIRPGIYQDDNGKDVPSHIHFTLHAEGYRMYASEFTFEDDPIFLISKNTEGLPVGKKVEPEGKPTYLVEIFMQKQ